MRRAEDSDTLVIGLRMVSPMCLDLLLGTLDHQSYVRLFFDRISRRFPLAFQFIFIFVLFGTVPWLPESPRWLIAHGGNEEAMQIIADLEATTIDDPWVITEAKEIQWAVRYHCFARVQLTC